jgi:hypothetical protein
MACFDRQVVRTAGGDSLMEAMKRRTTALSIERRESNPPKANQALERTEKSSEHVMGLRGAGGLAKFFRRDRLVGEPPTLPSLLGARLERGPSWAPGPS